jgi:hypothetical protein
MEALLSLQFMDDSQSLQYKIIHADRSQKSNLQQAYTFVRYH